METSIIHNRKVTVMKRLLLLLGIVYAFFALPMYSQDITEDETDMLVYASSTAVQSDYLYVDVSGVGNVTFTMPSEKTVVCNGGNKYAQIPVKYGTVPGVGVLVTFSVSKLANVITSDGQTFSVTPNETKQILIQNLSYPQITIRF